MKQSRPELASAHYEEYFRQVVAHPDERPEAKTLVPVLLEFGALNSRLGRNNLALMNYDFAVKMAQQAERPDLESQAYDAAAQLEAKLELAFQAARSYQRMIALDAAGNDQRNQARDWFNYGQFLRQRHLASLAYACFLKSEELFRAAPPSPELKTATEVRQQLETELGKQSFAVRRDLPGALAQASALEQKDFSKESGN